MLELFNPPLFERNVGDELKLFRFSSIALLVAVNKLIVEGGRIRSSSVGSSSEISEYAGDEVGGGVGILGRFLFELCSFFVLESK